VQLEGLGKLKKLNNLIVTRISELPTCSIVPQLTTDLLFQVKQIKEDLMDSAICGVRETRNMQIFGEETSLKATTSNTENEMGR
jgi:hypothetical protein